jgi:hypothetical protein
MASREEALEILKQWSGSNSLLDCFIISSVPPIEPQGEMMPMGSSYDSVTLASLEPDKLVLAKPDGKRVPISLPLEANFWILGDTDMDPLHFPKGKYEKRIQWELTGLTYVVLAKRVKWPEKAK